MDKESLIEKIRALLALSDTSRNSSTAEAETAAIKVQELLRKHNIQMAEVLADDNLDCEIEIEQCEFSDKLTNQKWETLLTGCVCLMTNTQSFVQKEIKCWNKTRYKCFFVGTKEDCEVAKDLYIYLYRIIVRFANQYETSFSRRSFIMGFLQSIYNRIIEQQKVQETTEKYEMVLVKKEKGISDFLEKIGVKFRPVRKSQTYVDPEAYNHGKVEGSRADIGQKKLETREVYSE
jgi:hypothetical protein